MTELTLVIAYGVVAVLAFAVAVPIVFRITAADFGHDRDAYAFGLIACLIAALGAAMIWPVALLVFGLVLVARKYWDVVHIRRSG